MQSQLDCFVVREPMASVDCDFSSLPDFLSSGCLMCSC